MEPIRAVVLENDDFEYRSESILIALLAIFNLSGFRFQGGKQNSYLDEK